MMNALKFALAAALIVPAFALANGDDAQDFRPRTRCAAQAIDRYYCPVSSNWWEGPFFDNGCSVKCQAGEKAVCVTASCDNGRPVPSSCSCQ